MGKTDNLFQIVTHELREPNCHIPLSARIYSPGLKWAIQLFQMYDDLKTVTSVTDPGQPRS